MRRRTPLEKVEPPAYAAAPANQAAERLPAEDLPERESVSTS